MIPTLSKASLLFLKRTYIYSRNVYLRWKKSKKKTKLNVKKELKKIWNSILTKRKRNQKKMEFKSNTKMTETTFVISKSKDSPPIFATLEVIMRLYLRIKSCLVLFTAS